jgi:hypothetical protein
MRHTPAKKINLYWMTTEVPLAEAHEAILDRVEGTIPDRNVIIIDNENALMLVLEGGRAA